MFAFNRRLLTIGALALTAAACAPSTLSDFTEADQNEIRVTTDQALAIANGSKDWGQYAEVYYSPDAIVMPPNQGVVQGHEAIIAFFEEFPPFTDLTFTTVEVDGAGDIAYVYGIYSMLVMLPDEEEPVPDNGKYIEIWKRQANGSWKLALDIFNSDVPLPEG
jgi:ketosteroid isomerase-like protein